MKRLLDLAVAALVLAAGLPFWVLLAVLVRLDSVGPAFFVQERIGRRGRPFRMLKFRSMHRGADPYKQSPVQGDPGVTRVGGLLRITGLDEAPQLLNVLRGETSLVGPRPEMPFVVERYTPLERGRLEAVPGISGLWQLYGDRTSPMHEQVELDLVYIAFRSLRLDLRILASTLAFPFRALTRLARRRVSLHAPLHDNSRP